MRPPRRIPRRGIHLRVSKPVRRRHRRARFVPTAPRALTVAVGQATVRDTARRILPRLLDATRPEWSLSVIQRNGTFIADLNPDQAISLGAITDFHGNDPLNDIGTGEITMPITSAFTSAMVEDSILLLYLRNVLTTGMLIGQYDATVVSDRDEQGELVTFSLSSLLDLLSEGTVQPARGMAAEPPGDDRRFDSSDPAFSGAGFQAAHIIMSVTDAQAAPESGGWPLPFAQDMGDGDNVMVIGPGGPDSNQPPGYYYYYNDIYFPAGMYRFESDADDQWEVRLDGTTIIPWGSGFNAVRSADVQVSDGTHRVWAKVLNGPPQPANPTALAIRIAMLDPGGTDIGLFAATDGTWLEWDDVGRTPGFTLGQIVNLCLAENQALGLCMDIRSDINSSVDANGALWPTIFPTTKAGNSLSTFFLKELGETYGDFEMVPDDALGGGRLRVWLHGTRGDTIPVTIAAGTNLRSFSVHGQRTAATQFMVRWLSEFLRVSTMPLAGHPPKETMLSLGAQASAEEATTVAAQQLTQFGRPRAKLSVGHLTNTATSDAEYPGVSYWTGDTITVPTDINQTAGADRVIDMAWQLSAVTGELEFTPGVGDLFQPPEVWPRVALSKMAPGSGIHRVPSSISV